MSKDSNKFFFFYGGWASQWQHSEFVIDDVKYYSCEQYMMAQKAVLFDDNKTYKLIMKEKDPRKVKKLGREVKNFKDSVWNKNRCRIVYEGNYAKFTQNNNLKEKLLKTKDKIIAEASAKDNIWGIGMYEHDPNIMDQKKWGLNLLGQVLMEVRDKIKNNGTQLD
jgi:ribA/ribD-fused uncharacterized protein